MSLLYRQLAPVPLRVQAEAFRAAGAARGRLVAFRGMEAGRDVYNPSTPMWIDGQEMIAGRTERREAHDSVVCFFRRAGEAYERIEDAPTFALEDPFWTRIGDELVFGGVEVDWKPDGSAVWTTVFYRGRGIYDLRPFARGPERMKDIRLVALADGRIGVFTRPQGERILREHGCIAKIGFTVIPSLCALTPEAIESAPFLGVDFPPDEWGGCNEARLLEGGLVGVVGHKAYRSREQGGDQLHYCGIAFAMDPATLEVGESHVIISRDCFPKGPAKRPDLADVTFTAGLVAVGGGKARVVCGLSDCQVGEALVDDPFA